MSGPFQMLGPDDAPACVDGVCELPAGTLPDAQVDEIALGARGERR